MPFGFIPDLAFGFAGIPTRCATVCPMRLSRCATVCPMFPVARKCGAHSEVIMTKSKD